MRGEVFNRPVERDEFRIVELRDIDAEAMVDGGDKIQEVHGIDVEGFTQVGCGIDARQINFGRNIIEFLLHRLLNVDVAHSLSGSCSSRPISAKNNAPACPSLTRWSADSVMVTTERGPTAPSMIHGRVIAFPKPTIATWGG